MILSVWPNRRRSTTPCRNRTRDCYAAGPDRRSRQHGRPDPSCARNHFPHSQVPSSLHMARPPVSGADRSWGRKQTTRAAGEARQWHKADGRRVTIGCGAVRAFDPACCPFGHPSRRIEPVVSQARPQKYCKRVSSMPASQRVFPGRDVDVAQGSPVRMNFRSTRTSDMKTAGGDAVADAAYSP